MKQVNVIAPAKLNISLDITGVDEKGYHLLDMIMQTVSVFERITLTKQDEISRFHPVFSVYPSIMAMGLVWPMR